MLLKQAPNASGGEGTKIKSYYVLAMVSPDTKSGVNGQYPTLLVRQCNVLTFGEDVDAQARPPRWPPQPEWLLVDEPVYDLLAVPITSIAMASYESIKVRAGGTHGDVFATDAARL